MTEQIKSNEQTLFQRSVEDTLRGFIGSIAAASQVKDANGNVDMKRAGMVSGGVAALGTGIKHFKSFFTGEFSTEQAITDSVRGANNAIAMTKEGVNRWLSNKAFFDAGVVGLNVSAVPKQLVKLFDGCENLNNQQVEAKASEIMTTLKSNPPVRDNSLYAYLDMVLTAGSKTSTMFGSKQALEKPNSEKGKILKDAFVTIIKQSQKNNEAQTSLGFETGLLKQGKDGATDAQKASRMTGWASIGSSALRYVGSVGTAGAVNLIPTGFKAFAGKLMGPMGQAYGLLTTAALARKQAEDQKLSVESLVRNFGSLLTPEDFEIKTNGEGVADKNADGTPKMVLKKAKQDELVRIIQDRDDATSKRIGLSSDDDALTRGRKVIGNWAEQTFGKVTLGKSGEEISVADTASYNAAINTLTGIATNLQTKKLKQFVALDRKVKSLMKNNNLTEEQAIDTVYKNFEDRLYVQNKKSEYLTLKQSNPNFADEFRAKQKEVVESDYGLTEDTSQATAQAIQKIVTGLADLGDKVPKIKQLIQKAIVNFEQPDLVATARMHMVKAMKAVDVEFKQGKITQEEKEERQSRIMEAMNKSITEKANENLVEGGKEFAMSMISLLISQTVIGGITAELGGIFAKNQGYIIAGLKEEFLKRGNFGALPAMAQSTIPVTQLQGNLATFEKELETAKAEATKIRERIPQTGNTEEKDSLTGQLNLANERTRGLESKIANTQAQIDQAQREAKPTEGKKADTKTGEAPKTLTPEGLRNIEVSFNGLERLKNTQIYTGSIALGEGKSLEYIAMPNTTGSPDVQAIAEKNDLSKIVSGEYVFFVPKNTEFKDGETGQSLIEDLKNQVASKGKYNELTEDPAKLTVTKHKEGQVFVQADSGKLFVVTKSTTEPTTINNEQVFKFSEIKAGTSIEKVESSAVDSQGNRINPKTDQAEVQKSQSAINGVEVTPKTELTADGKNGVFADLLGTLKAETFVGTSEKTAGASRLITLPLDQKAKALEFVAKNKDFELQTNSQVLMLVKKGTNPDLIPALLNQVSVNADNDAKFTAKQTGLKTENGVITAELKNAQKDRILVVDNKNYIVTGKDANGKAILKLVDTTKIDSVAPEAAKAKSTKAPAEPAKSVEAKGKISPIEQKANAFKLATKQDLSGGGFDAAKAEYVRYMGIAELDMKVQEVTIQANGQAVKVVGLVGHDAALLREFSKGHKVISYGAYNLVVPETIDGKPVNFEAVGKSAVEQLKATYTLPTGTEMKQYEGGELGGELFHFKNDGSIKAGNCGDIISYKGEKYSIVAITYDGEVVAEKITNAKLAVGLKESMVKMVATFDWLKNNVGGYFVSKIDDVEKAQAPVAEVVVPAVLEKAPVEKAPEVVVPAVLEKAPEPAPTPETLVVAQKPVVPVDPESVTPIKIAPAPAEPVVRKTVDPEISKAIKPSEPGYFDQQRAIGREIDAKSGEMTESQRPGGISGGGLPPDVLRQQAIDKAATKKLSSGNSAPTLPVKTTPVKAEPTNAKSEAPKTDLSTGISSIESLKGKTIPSGASLDNQAVAEATAKLERFEGSVTLPRNSQVLKENTAIDTIKDGKSSKLILTPQILGENKLQLEARGIKSVEINQILEAQIAPSAEEVQKVGGVVEKNGKVFVQTKDGIKSYTSKEILSLNENDQRNLGLSLDTRNKLGLVADREWFNSDQTFKVGGKTVTIAPNLLKNGSISELKVAGLSDKEIRAIVQKSALLAVDQGSNLDKNGKPIRNFAGYHTASWTHVARYEEAKRNDGYSANYFRNPKTGETKISSYDFVTADGNVYTLGTNDIKNLNERTLTYFAPKEQAVLKQLQKEIQAGKSPERVVIPPIELSKPAEVKTVGGTFELANKKSLVLTVKEVNDSTDAQLKAKGLSEEQIKKARGIKPEATLSTTAKTGETKPAEAPKFVVKDSSALNNSSISETDRKSILEKVGKEGFVTTSGQVTLVDKNGKLVSYTSDQVSKLTPKDVENLTQDQKIQLDRLRNQVSGNRQTLGHNATLSALAGKTRGADEAVGYAELASQISDQGGKSITRAKELALQIGEKGTVTEAIQKEVRAKGGLGGLTADQVLSLLGNTETRQILAKAESQSVMNSANVNLRTEYGFSIGWLSTIIGGGLPSLNLSYGRSQNVTSNSEGYIPLDASDAAKIAQALKFGEKIQAQSQEIAKLQAQTPTKETQARITALTEAQRKELSIYTPEEAKKLTGLIAKVGTIEKGGVVFQDSEFEVTLPGGRVVLIEGKTDADKADILALTQATTAAEREKVVARHLFRTNKNDPFLFGRKDEVALAQVTSTEGVAKADVVTTINQLTKNSELMYAPTKNGVPERIALAKALTIWSESDPKRAKVALEVLSTMSGEKGNDIRDAAMKQLIEKSKAGDKEAGKTITQLNNKSITIEQVIQQNKVDNFKLIQDTIQAYNPEKTYDSRKAALIQVKKGVLESIGIGAGVQEREGWGTDLNSAKATFDAAQTPEELKAAGKALQKAIHAYNFNRLLGSRLLGNPKMKELTDEQITSIDSKLKETLKEINAINKALGFPEDTFDEKNESNTRVTLSGLGNVGLTTTNTHNFSWKNGAYSPEAAAVGQKLLNENMTKTGWDTLGLLGLVSSEVTKRLTNGGLILTIDGKSSSSESSYVIDAENARLLEGAALAGVLSKPNSGFLEKVGRYQKSGYNPEGAAYLVALDQIQTTYKKADGTPISEAEAKLLAGQAARGYVEYQIKEALNNGSRTIRSKDNIMLVGLEGVSGIRPITVTPETLNNSEFKSALTEEQQRARAVLAKQLESYKPTRGIVEPAASAMEGVKYGNTKIVEENKRIDAENKKIAEENAKLTDKSQRQKPLQRIPLISDPKKLSAIQWKMVAGTELIVTSVIGKSGQLKGEVAFVLPTNTSTFTLTQWSVDSDGNIKSKGFDQECEGNDHEAISTTRKLQDPLKVTYKTRLGQGGGLGSKEGNSSSDEEKITVGASTSLKPEKPKTPESEKPPTVGKPSAPNGGKPVVIPAPASTPPNPSISPTIQPVPTNLPNGSIKIGIPTPSSQPGSFVMPSANPTLGNIPVANPSVVIPVPLGTTPNVLPAVKGLGVNPSAFSIPVPNAVTQAPAVNIFANGTSTGTILNGATAVNNIAPAASGLGRGIPTMFTPGN